MLKMSYDYYKIHEQLEVSLVYSSCGHLEFCSEVEVIIASYRWFPSPLIRDAVHSVTRLSC